MPMNQAVPFDFRFGLGLRLTEMLCRNVNTIVSNYMVSIPELMHKCFFFCLHSYILKTALIRQEVGRFPSGNIELRRNARGTPSAMSSSES